MRLPNSDFHLFWGKLSDDELSNQTVNSLELNGCLGADPYLLDKPSKTFKTSFLCSQQEILSVFRENWLL